MTNSQAYESGIGSGITWKAAGRCEVRLDADSTPKSIKILATGKVVTTSGDSPSQSLKPYQNPTGKWMQGVWENNAKRSAIFAVVSW